jgi:hypothetical protein
MNITTIGHYSYEKGREYSVYKPWHLLMAKASLRPDIAWDRSHGIYIGNQCLDWKPVARNENIIISTSNVEILESYLTNYGCPVKVHSSFAGITCDESVLLVEQQIVAGAWSGAETAFQPEAQETSLVVPSRRAGPAPVKQQATGGT